MKFSILIPHYKVGKITAYAIAQILKNKGRHDVEIFVVNNNSGDESERYFQPFIKEIKYFEYPKHKLQSHGIAIDWILPEVKTDWFITLENDAFPVTDTWLDYYENIITIGFDSAVSLLKLSGGTYGHPCGGLFNKLAWMQAKKYCETVEYVYFPNFAVNDNFQYHTMVHKSILNKVLACPEDYIELSEPYVGKSSEEIMNMAEYYSATICPFHNGMGSNNESVRTYGFRNDKSEVPNVLLNNKKKIILRVGQEPGAWFYFWQIAMSKKIFHIPIEIKWMPNRENQQHEYTLNEAGVKHLWAISSYTERNSNGVEDIHELKNRIPEELYLTLPKIQRIN